LPYFDDEEDNTKPAATAGTVAPQAQSPTEDYSWDHAKTDPDLLPAIHRYAKNVEGKTFRDDAEAFDWFTGDRRWKDANTVSALKELNFAAGGWGAKHASKEDLQDLATIRDRWDRLPGGLSRIAHGDIAGGAEAIGENLAKGLADPTVLLGGLAAKGASRAATKMATGMAVDAAVTAGANAAYQEGNIAISKEHPELGLQTELDPWSMLASGGMGAVLSAPGHYSVAYKKDPKLDIKQALEQTQAGYKDIKKRGINEIFTPKTRDNMVPKEAAEEIEKINTANEVKPEYPTGEPVLNLNNATEARMKDLNSLEGTLASKLKIPSPKIEEKAKQVYDYISGKLVNINSTTDLLGLVQNVEGRFGDELFAKDATQGVQTWAATEAAAKKGLKGQDLEKAAKTITDLPKNYNPSAVESRAVDIVRGALYNKWDEAVAKLEKDPTNTDLAKESDRLFDMWSDLEVKRQAMSSEAGRALRIRAYTQNTPESIFMKAGQAASKVLNVASGNKSKFSIDPQHAIDMRNAVKTLTNDAGEVDPLKVDLFLTNLENQKQGGGDMLREAWYNSLLSSPSTWGINAIGNAVTTGLHMTEATLGSAMSGVNPKYILAGYFKSIPESLKVAFRTFRTEIPNDPATRIELKEAQAIPSYIWDDEKPGLWRFRKAGIGEVNAFGGKQARLPGRILMSMDDMAKVPHYRAGLTDAAIQEIKAEEAKRGVKYTQNEFQQLLDEKVSKPSDNMQEYARNIARTLTFTSPLGKIGTGIQHIIDDIPGGRLIVPFVRTPGNIVKYAADMMSIPGTPLMTKRTAEDFAAGGIRANRAKARLITGYGIMAAGFWGALTGYVNGAGPSDPGEKAVWDTNNLAWSVKVGNRQIQWNRLDPVALPFAIGAGATDIIRSLNNDDKENAFWETTAKLFADAVLDKTWFQGVENVMSAITDPEKGGAGFVNGIARTFVPSVIAGSARAYDPRVMAPQTFMEVIQDRIGFDQRKKLAAKLDIFGREVPVDVWGASPKDTGVAGYVGRMVSPFKAKDVDADPIGKELANLRVSIKPPAKRWNGTELDSEQYYVYSKAKGQYLYNGLKYIMQDPAWASTPVVTKRVIIDTLQTEASKVGDVMLVGTYPELIKQKYVDNNSIIKKLKSPTQEQINERTFHPFTNPKLQEAPKPQSAIEPAKKPVETANKALTSNTIGGITSVSGLEVLASNAPGVSYDPLTHTITRGPDVSDDAISALVKGRNSEWENQTIKVKLEDGSTVDVPAKKAARIMKSKLKTARRLLEEYTSEA